MLQPVQYNSYIKCLNEARYFDAHEVLEEIWFPVRFEKNPEVLLLKGLINAAVSFELIKRGRVKASKRVWNNYIKYKIYLDEIAPIKPLYLKLSIEVEELSMKLHV